jgi:uncharacterized repeat protein (TIGR03803 family)
MLKLSSCYALSFSVIVALLAGCGVLRQAQDDMQPPIGASGTLPQASAFAARAASTNYKVVYSFGAAPDGSYPRASLIDMGGTLYGTTAGGGSNSCAYYPYSPYNGCGTVFSITPSGTEKVLYRFGSAPDGSVPLASLLDVGGTLYGTTAYGGPYTCGYPGEPFSCGTVFSITTSGTEKVLHSFGKRNDGRYPVAGLIKVKGMLYGTTNGGGANYCAYAFDILCGTVFSITPGGTEEVLYSFSYGRHPNTPDGSLIDVGGTLYGTTTRGAAHQDGTVFSVTLRGRVKVLHKFGSGTDGKTPRASLIDVGGTLYGTTGSGGASGYGTVFSITTSGKETVLHSFGTGPGDGESPWANLIDVNGTLYGTTFSGGANGTGTVYSITTNGTEQVLHSFGSSSSDGRMPLASLTDVNGTLYGTTYLGGAHNDGTVFTITP